jgi:hypothetical protein
MQLLKRRTHGDGAPRRTNSIDSYT